MSFCSEIHMWTVHLEVAMKKGMLWMVKLSHQKNLTIWNWRCWRVHRWMWRFELAGDSCHLKDVTMVERRECTLEHVSRGNVGRMNSFLQNAWKGHGVFNFRLKCTLQNQTFLFVQACQEPPTKRAKPSANWFLIFMPKKVTFDVCCRVNWTGAAGRLIHGRQCQK